MTEFVELGVTTNFSFLCGVSYPEEFAFQAWDLGLSGSAAADRNTLAGLARAHIAAEESNVAYAPGARLVFCEETPDLFAWPRDRAAYGRLAQLLTLGNRRNPKGECHLALDDFLGFGEGMALALDSADHRPDAMLPTIRKIRDAFPKALRLLSNKGFWASDDRRIAALSALARQEKTPLLADSLPLCQEPGRRILQNVVT